jgi:hypothetical protein
MQFAAARLLRFSGPRSSRADRSSRRVSRAVAGPPTDWGCKAAIHGAAAHRRIRRATRAAPLAMESASRNRKFESSSLQWGVCELSVPQRRTNAAPKTLMIGWRRTASIPIEHRPSRAAPQLITVQRRREPDGSGKKRRHGPSPSTNKLPKRLKGQLRSGRIRSRQKTKPASCEAKPPGVLSGGSADPAWGRPDVRSKRGWLLQSSA